MTSKPNKNMKNWRTTIIGALLSGVTAISIYQGNGGNLEDWKLWILPAIMQVLGFLAKDAWISGGVKILIGTLLCAELASCVNTTVTSPDGTVTVTKRVDSEAINSSGKFVTNVAPFLLSNK